MFVYIVLFLLFAYTVSLICKSVETDENGKVIKKTPNKIFAPITYLAADFLRVFFRIKVKVINKDLLPTDDYRRVKMFYQ